MKIYGSYSFIDKDPVIDVVRTTIQKERISYGRIEQISGVTSQTLRNWFEGKTKRPQHATVEAVMRAMGYSAKWQKQRKT